MQRHKLSIVLIFFATTLFAGALGSIMSANATETGVRGIVMWGPLKPGPEKMGQSIEAPLAATFAVLSEDGQIAQFTTDRMGQFELALPPGDYTIVPDKKIPIPNARRQITRVTVPDNGYIEITIRLDTGMK